MIARINLQQNWREWFVCEWLLMYEIIQQFITSVDSQKTEK